MRIWIVNHYAIPPTFGGITRHYSLSKYLVKEGHKVVIIACNYNHFTKQKLINNSQNGISKVSVDGVNFVLLDAVEYKSNSIKRFFNIIDFAFKAFFKEKNYGHDRPDVIIGSSPDPFSTFAAERLANKHKVPFVYEVRDLWPETLVSLGVFSSKHPMVFVFSCLEKYLFNKSSLIISIINRMKEYMKSCGCKEKDILVLPNGVDLEEFPAACPAEDGEVVTFMYAGSHGVANGLDVVIKAAKILEDDGFSARVRVLFVGDGAQKKNLQLLAKDLNVEVVSFLDMVPKEKIYGELKKADVFLMLLKEASVFKWGVSPNKLYDYFAMGRPVIFGINSSNNPVEDCHGGMTVSPSDPLGLADAMKAFVDMPYNKRLEMGVNARSYVEQNNSVEGLAQKLISALERCIKDNIDS